MSKNNPTNDPAIRSQSELDEQLSPLTNAQLEEQTSALDREMKELDLIIKRETVANFKRKHADRQAEIRQRLDATKNEIAQRDYLRNHQCTHRKGGRGHNAVIGGHGTDPNYALIHHVLPTGRHWIMCQRCGDEQMGVDPLTGERETPKYREFLSYPTDNTASGSTLFLPVRQPVGA